MSDSDEDVQQQDYAIRPEKGVATMDTSDWPLLLKVSHSLDKALARRRVLD